MTLPDNAAESTTKTPNAVGFMKLDGDYQSVQDQGLENWLVECTASLEAQISTAYFVDCVDATEGSIIVWIESKSLSLLNDAIVLLEGLDSIQIVDIIYDITRMIFIIKKF